MDANWQANVRSKHPTTMAETGRGNSRGSGPTRMLYDASQLLDRFDVALIKLRMTTDWHLRTMHCCAATR